MYLTNAFCVTDALVSICFTNDTHRNSYMVNEYYVHLIYFFSSSSKHRLYRRPVTFALSQYHGLLYSIYACQIV